ncbi:hypothetical protein HII13_005166 [Brettanomyces bruxellensis]|uniref:Uncharacterized protein n=1 Tax=Dekkera bruxellensis TaxID=5007 RepID=A0A8H6B7E3_DEKBR|nr:hypothetical protein HII13_005166 [Brettanomyces bruxellensis]KAF6006588.1 hypothetical protein HII12_004986 [Brettanomyces bruxellensis]
MNVRWFKPYLKQDAIYPKEPPHTDLEVRDRLSEIIGIAGIDYDKKTYDVYWQDCDPEHASTIPMTYFDLLDAVHQNNLFENLKMIRDAQKYLTDPPTTNEVGSPPEGYTDRQ